MQGELAKIEKALNCDLIMKGLGQGLLGGSRGGSRGRGGGGLAWIISKKAKNEEKEKEK